MSIRLFVLLLAASLSVCACAPACAAHYSICAVGISSATSINNQGEVCGRFVDGSNEHLATWSPRDGVTLLKPSGMPPFTAVGINDLGNVISRTNNDSTFWHNPSSPTPIAIPNADRVQVQAMNQDGQVTGYAHNRTTHISTAFVWENGTLSLLPTTGGVSGIGLDISSTGLVCGTSYDAALSPIACLWRDNTMYQLQDLAGYSSTEACKVNDLGQIIGNAFNAATNIGRACMWDSYTATPVELPRPSYYTDSVATAINNSGQVVGYCRSSYRAGAFLWQNGSCVDLSTLLPSGSGWSLESAFDINDNGQILGIGYYRGSRINFVMTPVPEPSSILALVIGLVSTGVAVVRRRQ